MIVVLENFASTLAEVIAKTKVRHVIVTSMGELMGVQMWDPTGRLGGVIAKRMAESIEDGYQKTAAFTRDYLVRHKLS